MYREDKYKIMYMHALFPAPIPNFSLLHTYYVEKLRSLGMRLCTNLLYYNNVNVLVYRKKNNHSILHMETYPCLWLIQQVRV